MFDEWFVKLITVVLYWNHLVASYINIYYNSIGLGTSQRQVIYYRGILHSFNTICKEEGFLGLYKGLGATLLVSFAVLSLIRYRFILVTLFNILLFLVMQGVGLSIAISFSVYESRRSFWQSRRWGIQYKWVMLGDVLCMTRYARCITCSLDT